MIVAYTWPTRVGTFAIRLNRSGRWVAMFEDEKLGEYDSPQRACDDLSMGTTHCPSCGDPSRFNLPDQVDEWKAARLR